MTNSLTTRFKPMLERIDAMSLRERAMVFLIVMAMIVVVALQLLFVPLRAEHDRVVKSVNAKNEQAESMNQQVQTMLGEGGNNSAQKQQITALELELKTIDEQLSKVTGGMVSPQQMAKLLEQALARQQGVELVKVETLPRSLAFGDLASAEGGKSTGAVVYRHGVRIEVKGRYFDLVNYLKALEALSWKVYWGEVALNSETYPTSTMTLVIYTLSRHPGWIGV